MPLGFGRPKSEDVVTLITEKKYSRAIEILRAQLKKRGASTTLRKQLADVLVLSGKKSEAIALLIPLADQFAREGFAAKAVSILKKIQKIDPSRRDVDERLARLIEEKQRDAIVLPVSRPGMDIGMEEIGIEPPPSGPIDIPVAPLPAPDEPAPAPEEIEEDGPDLEIGIGPSGPLSTPADAPPPEIPADTTATEALEPEPSETEETPAIASPEASDLLPAPPAEEAPIALPPPEPPAPPDDDPDATLPLPPAPAPMDSTGDGWLGLADTPAEPAEKAPDDIEDYDLLYVPDGDEVEDETASSAGDAAAPLEGTAEQVMSDGAFADELMSLVDSVFQESSEGAFDIPEPTHVAGPRRTGEQIVVSPLFRDFSVDEMVAVIQGLKLLSFDRGEVILRQGQPGGSLYMLTSGRVRAFRKDPQTRKQVKVADLTEGAFFGEISILTGEPRSASIVALNACELLELDRPTLDEITKSHPHVWDVLREFAAKRSQARE